VALPAAWPQPRKAFDVWSFVKSPYGIMMVLMGVALWLFSTIDPEEYKQQVHLPAPAMQQPVVVSKRGHRNDCKQWAGRLACP
jgi:hypothetical protein